MVQDKKITSLRAIARSLLRAYLGIAFPPAAENLFRMLSKKILSPSAARRKKSQQALTGG
jgi:hypothetical protein